MSNFLEEIRRVRYIECMCSDISHTSRISWWSDKCKENNRDWDELTFESQLNLLYPWYRRLWLSAKYVFGYQCKYSHWDKTSLDVAGVKQLKEICEEFLAESTSVATKEGD